MTTTTTRRRADREPTVTAPTRADDRGMRAQARARSERYAELYAAGRDGLPLVEHPTSEEREAHAAGRADATRERRTKITGTARRAARAAGSGLASVGTVTAGGIGSAATSTATGTGWSWMGLIWGALGLVVLYLLLTKAGLAARVVNGATRAVTWFVSPTPLPI